jgi:hypothetical protein
MNRRTFLSLSGAAALTRTSLAAPAPASKRERMLGWLAGQGASNYTPAAFFLHFGNDYKAGPAAAKRHLEFSATPTWISQDPFEQTTRARSFCKNRPTGRSSSSPARFLRTAAADCRELVKAEKKNSLILMTLYSPFMSAGQCATTPCFYSTWRRTRSGQERPRNSYRKPTAVRTRVHQRGHRWFLYFTQGSKRSASANPGIFGKYVKPFDLSR